MPSNSYHYETNDNFEKLLDQEGAENTLMIALPILLVICMHIGPTKLLKDNTSNVEFDGDGRLRTVSTDLD